MELFFYLLFGGIVGFLAALLVKGESYGVVPDIEIGLLGGLIGGWLVGELGIGGGSLASIVAAVAGAIILICILRATKLATA